MFAHGRETVSAQCLGVFADADETVSLQGDFALAEQVRSRSGGEHCPTFPFIHQDAVVRRATFTGGTGTHRGLAEKESWN